MEGSSGMNNDATTENFGIRAELLGSWPYLVRILYNTCSSHTNSVEETTSNSLSTVSGLRKITSGRWFEGRTKGVVKLTI